MMIPIGESFWFSYIWSFKSTKPGQNQVSSYLSSNHVYSNRGKVHFPNGERHYVVPNTYGYERGIAQDFSQLRQTCPPRWGLIRNHAIFLRTLSFRGVLEHQEISRKSREKGGSTIDEHIDPSCAPLQLFSTKHISQYVTKLMTPLNGVDKDSCKVFQSMGGVG